MALIGRVTCPWCGNKSAHVKQNPGKLPFVHCPVDGILTQARNEHQAALLLANMRPEGAAPTPPEPPKGEPPILVPPPPAAPVAPAAGQPSPKKPAGLFEQLLGKSK